MSYFLSKISRRYAVLEIIRDAGEMKPADLMANHSTKLAYLCMADCRRDLTNLASKDYLSRTGETFKLASAAIHMFEMDADGRGRLRKKIKPKAPVEPKPKAKAVNLAPPVLPPYQPPFKELSLKHIPAIRARRHDAEPSAVRPHYSSGTSPESMLRGSRIC